MAGNAERPDEVSSMMEELWGPRGKAPVEATRDPRPARADDAPPEHPMGAGGDELRDTVALLRQLVDARFAEAVGRARADLEGLRSHLDAVMSQIADELARSGEAAVAAADAGVAGAEARLLGRLDDLAAGVAQAAERSAAGGDVLARLVDVEKRLAEETARPAPSTRPGPVDLVSLRSELEKDLAGMLQARHADLEHAVEARVGETQAELGTLSGDVRKLARTQEELNRALEGIAEQVSRSAANAGGNADDVERTVAEAVGLLAERLAVRQSELQAALEARVEQLQVALDREAARVGAAVDRAERAGTDVVRVTGGNEELARAHEDLSGRLDQMVERLERLQATVDRQRDQVAATLASQRTELEQALRTGLADVQPATTMAPAADDGRLEALEGEISELGEYHAALDTGLGALRTEIGELRDAMRKMARDQTEVLDRAETPTRAATSGDAEQGRGRRTGRKGETETRMAAVQSATEGLVGEHQRLKGDMARLEQEARAAADTSGLLRNDVRLLRAQVAEQNEALDALRAAVEAPAKRAPSRAPAAKRTPRPNKD